jgi:hypothetical protein
MNKRPGHVVVTTEVAVCSFCGRPRTLRIEQHQLGTLVRTIVTCETCHRTLSSSMGLASTEPADSESAAVEANPEVEPTAAEQPAKAQRANAAARPAARSAAERRSAANTDTKATASKSRTQKKTR